MGSMTTTSLIIFFDFSRWKSKQYTSNKFSRHTFLKPLAYINKFRYYFIYFCCSAINFWTILIYPLSFGAIEGKETTSHFSSFSSSAPPITDFITTSCLPSKRPSNVGLKVIVLITLWSWTIRLDHGCIHRLLDLVLLTISMWTWRQYNWFARQ